MGSRWFDEDTGADWRFSGSAWGEVGRAVALNKLILDKLDELLTEMRRQNGHLQAGSELDSEEALEFARG